MTDLLEIINNQPIEYLDLSWNNLRPEDIETLFSLCKEKGVLEMGIMGNPVDSQLQKKVLDHFSKGQRERRAGERRVVDG